MGIAIGRRVRLRQVMAVGLVACGLLRCSGSASSSAKTGGQARAESSLSQPVLRCGPEDSYRYLANEFRCPDGKNPFGGDLQAAERSRRGSEPHPKNPHVVDIYRVSCEGGDAHVFIDMYGCEEYARRLVTDSPSPALKELVARYEARDFGGVARHCAEADTSMPPDEASECMTLLPASLVLLGRPQAGIVFLADVCSDMPAASSLSDIRAHVVIRTVAFVDHAREQSGEPLSNEEGTRLLGALATACQLDGDDIERYVRRRETL